MSALAARGNIAADPDPFAAYLRAKADTRKAIERLMLAALADDESDLAAIREWEAEQASIRGNEFDPVGFAAA